MRTHERYSETDSIASSPHGIGVKQNRLTSLFARFAREYPARTIIIFCCMVLAGLAEFISITTLFPILSIALGDGSTTGSRVSFIIDQSLRTLGISPSLPILLCTMVVLTTAKSALLLLSSSQLGYSAAHVMADLRLQLLRYTMNARWTRLATWRTGSLVNAVINETRLAAQAYARTCAVLSEAVLVTVYCLLAFLVSWTVSLAALVGGAVILIALHRIVQLTARSGQRLIEMLKSLSARLADALFSIKSIKAMGCENLLIPLLESDNEGLRRADTRMIVSQYGLPVLQEPVMITSMAVGLYLVLNVWALGTEELLVLALLFWRTVSRVANAQRNYQEARSMQGAFWSVLALIDEARNAGETRGGSFKPTLNHGIELRNVTFSYDGKPVLSNVSMTVPVGRLTGVTGLSGSGKTTLTDLIIGLMEPQAGEVLIDGIPLSELDLSSWRKMIGYVPQETQLLHDSIYLNVTLGDPSLTRGDAEAALRAAGAWEFVSALSESMDRVVGERGAKLSGGQRQRIAIARALVRKPSLLILDEVTASLDPETEAEICSTLVDLAGKVTTLAISHQRAILEVAPLVYRVDAGSVTVLKDGLAADSLEKQGKEPAAILVK